MGPTDTHLQMEPLCAGFSFPEGRNQIGCRVAHGADCALESYAGYAFWPRCAPSLVRDLEGVHAMCFEFSAPPSRKRLAFSI